MNKTLKITLYFTPVLLPILFMITVNEYVRYNNPHKFYFYGNTILNPVVAQKEKCTWYCHNDTRYCINNHMDDFSTAFRKKMDILYFGIINAMFTTGYYGAANIIFLVFAWPYLMYVLLIKNIRLILKIRKSAKQI